MKTGIYIITNTKNGMQYVGQSQDIEKRVQQHLSGNSHNPEIKRDIKRHGRHAFSTELIEYPGVSGKALDAIERWQILKRNTLTPAGYNATIGGGRSNWTLSEADYRLERERRQVLKEATDKKIQEILERSEDLPEPYKRWFHKMVEDIEISRDVERILEERIEKFLAQKGK